MFDPCTAHHFPRRDPHEGHADRQTLTLQFSLSHERQGDCSCYLPLYVFCGDQLLAAKLRTADIDASAGAAPGITPIPNYRRISL